MKILIPTVPHSGTHLLSSFFERAGFEGTAINNPRPPENAVITTHIDTPTKFNTVLKIMPNYQVVIPIRHPYLVAESWIRREQPLDRMLAAYRRLPALYDTGAMFVPIDSLDRDKYIQRINDALDIKLKPDWGTVVNGFKNTHTLTHKDLNPLPEVKQLANDISQFLANFYETDMIKEKAAPKKKAVKKVINDDELIEVIALRKMQNDATGEMAEIGDTVMKARKYARIMQDAGSIKVPI